MMQVSAPVSTIPSSATRGAIQAVRKLNSGPLIMSHGARSRLLEVAAQVRRSVRRIAIVLPSAMGRANVFAQVAARLGAVALPP